jgi:rhodanese-related sulfurtransferase
MSVPEIDVHELAKLREHGVALLDVRNPDEWEAARVPGVPLIPLRDLVELVDDVPDGEPLFIICATGARSERAAEYLRGLGRDAANVAGGTKAWMAAGYPTDSGPA